MIKSGIKIVLSRMFGALLVFLLHVYAARLLGVNEYGLFSFIWSALMLVAIFSVAGMDRSLMRQIAIINNTKDWCYAKGYYLLSIKLTISLAVLASLILVAVLYVNEVKTGLIVLGIVLLVLHSITKINEGILNGLGKAVFVSNITNIVRPIFIIVGIFILFKLSQTNAYWFLFVNVIALFLVIFIGNIYIFPKLENENKQQNAKEWLKSSFPFFLTSSAAIIQSNADIFMIGVLLTEKDVGVYTVASRISAVVIFAFGAINTVSAPFIAKTFKINDQLGLARIIAQNSLLVLSFAIISCVILLMFPEFFLGLFGEDYKVGDAILIALVLASMIFAVFGPVEMILLMTDWASVASKVVMVAAMINIIFNAIFIPYYGGIGAAYATLISFGYLNLMLMFKVWKHLGIMPGLFGLRLKYFI